MAETTGIEWCDHTFNPWTGCTKVSPACDHCYAESWAKRSGQVQWGNHPRKRTSKDYWRQPWKWNREACVSGVRRKVFCASLADVFDNQIPEEWRLELFDLIDSCRDLDWLILTKRPQNIKKMLPPDWDWISGWPHVWIGTTVENQSEAEKRIPSLLDIPTKIRFLSCEPMLGPIDLSHCGNHYTGSGPLHLWRPGHGENGGWRKQFSEPPPQIHWVICGGESGPGARPMHIEWAKSLRDQCAAADVPFFFKQWGEWISCLDRDVHDPDWRAPYSKFSASPKFRFLNLAGGCGFHGDQLHVMERVGKKNAGASLVGRHHREFPA